MRVLFIFLVCVILFSPLLLHYVLFCYFCVSLYVFVCFVYMFCLIIWFVLLIVGIVVMLSAVFLSCHYHPIVSVVSCSVSVTFSWHC